MNYKLVSSTFDDKEIKSINEVIKSDMYSMGKNVSKFEDQCSKYFKSKYCVMVNSGSSANLIALSAAVLSENIDINKGDEIIVTSLSWSTTYSPFYYLNLKPKYVDIDIETLNIDIKKIESSITRKTKAIFLVNITGNPNEFDEIKLIAKKNNLIIFEDNCESMGAKYKKKYCGTFGLFGTMSTFFSHHMCTIEGGIVLTNNREFYETMLSIRAHGWTRNLPKNSIIHKKKGKDFDELFNFILPGFNIRPIEFEGAIGQVQLKKLGGFVKNRIRNSKIFYNTFKKYEDFILQKQIEESSWFSFTIICKGKLENKREQLIKFLNDNKIETRPICGGDFTKSLAAKYLGGNYKTKMRNAEYVTKNGFFVGNTHKLLNNEIKYLKIKIDEFYKTI